VAYACATSATPFFAPIEQGSEDAAKAMGVSLSYSGISTNLTPQEMHSVLQAAINQHPDALVVCNFFPETENSLIKQATKEGIPVFSAAANTESLESGALTAYGQSDEQAGEQAAEEMSAAGVTDAICVDDVPTNPSVSARCTGFEKQMKAEGQGVKTVNLPNAAENTTAILNAITGELRSDSNINGVLTLGNVQGPAAVQAVKQAGKEGEVKVGTFDMSEEVLTELESGEMLFTVWQQPYLQGYLPVVSAALYLKYGMTPPGEVATGPAFITKENAEAVAPAVEGGVG
jgi:simple sugar transport system substrate-binding protein